MGLGETWRVLDGKRCKSTTTLHYYVSDTTSQDHHHQVCRSSTSKRQKALSFRQGNRRLLPAWLGELTGDKHSNHVAECK